MKKNAFVILLVILLLSLLCQGCSNACRVDFSTPENSETLSTETDNPTHADQLQQDLKSS